MDVETALAGVRIVLVEPLGPLNVGAIARVMKNMGLHQLVLVNPQCDILSPESRLMAVHAVDILSSAQVAQTIPAALRGCTRAIATTARLRSTDIQLSHPRAALPWLLGSPSAVIFGREDRGLSNAELNYAQRFVCIPSSPAYPSLNLAQAVAVCCYELYQGALGSSKASAMPEGFLRERSGCAAASIPKASKVSQKCQQPTAAASPGSALSTFPGGAVGTREERQAASREVLEAYYQQMEAVLLKIGYLYPHTAATRMSKFRRLFNRADPTAAEVAMLRGILRQVTWAIEHLANDQPLAVSAAELQFGLE
ncbi:MAG: RNA methyltransferase [Hormoscilla sp. GUM202]|nr:RNA methyltransferase [Hormoscilla sp. GUM202]